MRSAKAFGDIIGILDAHDPAGRLLAVQGAEVLGLDDRDPRSIRPVELVHPDDRATAARLLQGVADGDDPAFRDVVRLRHAAGYHRWFECDAEFRVDDPAIGGVLLRARDVTEKARAALLARLDARTHHDLLASRPLGEVLTQAVVELAEIFEARIAWVGLAEGDGSVRLAAAAGPLDQLLGPHEPRWDDTPLGQGAVGTAIREGRTVELTGDDPVVAAYRDSIDRLGVDIGIALPLREDDRTVGALSLVFDHRSALDEDTRVKLDAAASWLALALSLNRVRSTERVRAIVLASMANGVVTNDADGVITWMNAAFERQLGVDAADMIGRRTSFIDWQLQSSDVLADRSETLARGEVWQGEVFMRSSDGSLRRLIQTITPITDDDGCIVEYVGVHEDVTRLRHAEDELHRATTHDALTGLPTRQLLLDRLERDLASDREAHASTMVASVDIDGLKTVNELHGFAAGDALLVDVATALERIAGPRDTVARHAGDNFVVVCPALDSPDDALLAVDRLRSCTTRSVDDDADVVERSATIGVVLHAPGADAPDPENLLRDADLALHRAKAKGPGSVEFLDPDMRDQLIDRWALLEDLPRALGRGEFVLHYQPQHELETGTVCCVEALVRWDHPTQGLLAPGRFLHLAEEAGLLAVIDRATREVALAQLAEWRRELGEQTPIISLNLSVGELEEPGLAADLAAAVERHGIPPDQVCLEIVEQNLLESAATPELELLAEAGFLLAIDDFGAGYSSLAYLATLPVALLKLDRSLTRRLDDADDLRGATVVGAAIDLGHRLGMRVLAEGVETDRECDALRELGCDLVQGFLLSKPRPAGDIPGLVGGAPAP